MRNYFYRAVYRISFFVIAGLFVLVMASCSIFSSDETVSREELDELETQIREMIGEAPAEAEKYCKIVAFGSKPCGGPWSYLVYSSTHTNEARLNILVDKYNTMEDEYNRQHSIVSNCVVEPKPEAELHNGRCIAVYN